MNSRWTRTLVLVAVVALLAMAAFVVAACGEEEETTTTAAPETTTTAAPETTTTAATGGETTTTGAAAVVVKKIGVIVPEKANDYGWNQQHAEAGQKMAEKIGAEYVLADGAGYDDPAPVMRQLVEEGCDWIMAGASGYMTVAKQVAQEEAVRFNVIFSQENVPEMIQDMQTYAEQGAYLAGILAAKTSKTGTLGIVVSADDENWTKMSAGFIIAAQATRPDIEIKLAQVGQAAYADAPAAKRTTETLIAEGADVIFGMGDGSTFGMIQAVETATPPSGADKVWFIDVIGDKTSLDTKGIYLSSVVWDYLPAWEEAYAAMQAGAFGTETIWLELANNAIGIIKTQWIPDDLWAEIEAAKQDIIDGTIQVPAIDNMDEIQAMLK